LYHRDEGDVVSDDQIVVYEGNAPLIHFKFTDKVFDGTTNVPTRVPLGLSGASIAFYKKASPDAADPAATGTWTVTDAAGGEADLTLTDSDVGAKGTYWYRVDVTKGGATNTARAGYFIVKDG
jgi:hypothetical protein